MSERLDDGHSTVITFADGALSVYEKTVTPPGIDGGGANDTTTMLNTTWRTQAPKKLKTLTDATVTVAYKVEALNQILAMINSNQLITVTFPDNSTWAFWGWINTFAPSEIVEGEQPTAEMQLVPSNQNASGVETAPAFVQGTTTTA